MKVVLCTTCKGRLEHIQQTLPRNLADNPNATFVLLDYSSDDNLAPYLKENHAADIASGHLVVYQFDTTGPFQMAHAKNMAARLGIIEGADVLVTLDADNFAGQNFDRFVADNIKPGTFLCPDFPRIKSLPHGPLRPARGYAGRLAIRPQEFVKMGGYCETFDTWRGEDIDMIARMRRLGFTMTHIEDRFLNAIPHTAAVRFKEYPHAQQFETEGEWKAIYRGTATIVNYGRFGCGLARRNFGTETIELKPVPTRVLGLGMQRTCTSSLHAAFKQLGYDSFHWDSNQKAWAIWAEMNASGRSITLERSYALCDTPIPMLFRELDDSYPGSKFILTVRDESKWLKSVAALWDPKTNPWYDWHLQPFSHQLHKALYGRTDFDAEVFLARYRRHNAEVIEHFKGRPQDLLVMDIPAGDGWDKLCRFLGTPTPSTPFPVVNVTTKN